MSELGMDEIASGARVIRACGWSPAVMTASRSAGYKFKYGTRTTKRHYLSWRAAHPTFTSTAYIVQHSTTVRNRVGARGHSQRRRKRSDDQDLGRQQGKKILSASQKSRNRMRQLSTQRANDETLRYPTEMTGEIGLNVNEINSLKKKGCPFYGKKTSVKWVRLFLEKITGADALLYGGEPRPPLQPGNE
jgi:hypothetical protein